MSPRNLEDWPAIWTRALDDDALAQARTTSLFKRDKAYAATGVVKVTTERPWLEPAMQGWVSGTDLYVTEVWIEDDAVVGRCDGRKAQPPLNPDVP